MAAIHSAAEDNFVFNLISNPEYWYPDVWGNGEGPWIGGYDATGSFDWTWTNGSAWNYSNWGPGQPDNEGSERGANFFVYSPTWNDFNLNADTLGYIVEWSSFSDISQAIVDSSYIVVPEPGTIFLFGTMVGMLIVLRRATGRRHGNPVSGGSV